MLAFKTQTPGKYPKENILHKENGESLKWRRSSSYNSSTMYKAYKCSEFVFYNVISYHILSFILILWILTGLQNPYWYGISQYST
jgi:hypothetical protein